MSSKLLIDALGATVCIDLTSLTDADASAVRDAWRDALSVSEPVPVPEPVKRPTVTATASTDRASMLETLSQQVTLAALNARRGELWMLHAAGLASDDGRVVVLVGPSGRGKTTAARTLGETFAYVSDESVAIDDDGRVLPYRKPLSVIEQRGEPKAQRSPSELGLLALPNGPLQLAAIVLLDRSDDGPLAPVVEDVELGDALEDLVAQSSYLTAMSAPLHTIAALAAAAAGIRRVKYRDAASLRPSLDSLFAQTPATASRVAGEAGVSRPTEPTDPSTPRYFRTPYVDALTLPHPDRIAILYSADDGTGTLHVLAGVAPAVWRAADAASVTQLTDAALHAYGAPDGDASALVKAAVEELTSAGVLGTERWWRIRTDVAWVDHGARVVALALSDPTAAPLALEGSAAAIWRALDRGDSCTASAVAGRVAHDVGTTADAVIDDVSSFLEVLTVSSLVGDWDARVRD